MLTPIQLQTDIWLSVQQMSQKRVVLLTEHMAGDVAEWLEGRNSYPKTLGSIPWRGRVSSSFSLSHQVK